MDLKKLQSQGRALRDTKWPSIQDLRQKMRDDITGGIRKGEMTVIVAGNRTGKSRVTHAHVAELIELGLLSKTQVARQFGLDTTNLGINTRYYKLSDSDTNRLTLNEIAW